MSSGMPQFTFTVPGAPSFAQSISPLDSHSSFQGSQLIPGTVNATESAQFDRPQSPPFEASHRTTPSETTEPIVAPVAVDRLAHDMDLDDQQRQRLHTFVALGSHDATLSKSDLLTRVYILAAIFGDITERRRATQTSTIQDLPGLMADLKIRLEATFAFIPEQKANVRIVAMDVLYQPNRTSFKLMHLDVEAALRSDPAHMRLDNVFGNPAREKLLAAHIKRVCSSVRNAFRQDLRDSIMGKRQLTLAEFTYDSAIKYKCGGPGAQLEHGYTVHVAILRRFGLEHSELLSVEEAEEDDGGTADTPEPPTKRRKARGGGRVAEGEDFWSQVDTFFRNQITSRGVSLVAPGWRDYVNQTIQQDNIWFVGQSASRAVQSGSSISVEAPSPTQAGRSLVAMPRGPTQDLLQDLLR